MYSKILLTNKDLRSWIRGGILLSFLVRHKSHAYKKKIVTQTVMMKQKGCDQHVAIERKGIRTTETSIKVTIYD